MESYDEVYKIIKNLNKIDAKNYELLIEKYSKEVVNTVIENLIYEGNNIYKYDYYVSNIASLDEKLYDNSLEIYLNDIKGFDKLSLEENRKLLEKANDIIMKIDGIILDTKCEKKEKGLLNDRIKKFKNNCQDTNKIILVDSLYDEFLKIRNIIVEGNLRLVIFMTHKCHKFNKYFLDYIQNGNLGLMNAIEKYDLKYNVTFSTYACFWIRLYIGRNMPSILYNYKIPYDKVLENNKMNKVIELLEQRLGYEPSDGEIANYLNVSEKKVRKLKEIFYGTVSLETEIVTEPFEENDNITLKDCLEEDDDNFINVLMNKYMREEIFKIMEMVLTEREICILTKRYGLDGNEAMTLREVGAELQLSKDMIRRYETRAKNKIRTVGEHLHIYLR